MRARLMFLLLLAETTAAAPQVRGIATVYTRESCRREGTSGYWTASGEAFNERAYTCALRSYRFGGLYLVTAIKTGKEVIVRHTDFGPGKGPARRGVVIDLTPAAMLALGLTTGGMVRVVPYQPPKRDPIREELVAREIAWRRACLRHELRKMEANNQ